VEPTTPDPDPTLPEPAAALPPPEPALPEPAAVSAVYRHALPTRVAHLIVALCLPVLALSGLQIFNAHPALYWGDRSDRDRAILSLDAVPAPDGGLRGVTRVLGVEIDTTGVLGASRDEDGALGERGFPRWATLPSEQWLALGRRWHFFVAWVLALTGVGFTAWALAVGHYARDVVPWPRDLGGLGQSLRDHLRFRHPRGAAAARYNVMQKLAYATVLLAFAPLIVLTGLAMSPTVDAAVPFVVRALGGRQSARTLHFLLTFAFVGFIASHVFMVAATGVVNNVRSMITGWYRIHDGGHPDRHDALD
jgi:thiosulfate reductase cytochrome b subunit